MAFFRFPAYDRDDLKQDLQLTLHKQVFPVPLQASITQSLAAS